jgi:lysophospholipase L1-like esterase
MKKVALLLLFSLLSGVSAAEPRVINLGYPGENTTELDPRLDRALAEFKPTFLVLFAGGNDALNDKKFVPPDQTELHLEAMVHRAQLTGVSVLLVTVHDPDVVRLMQRHKVEAYGETSPLQRLAMVNSAIAFVAMRTPATLVRFHDTLQKKGGASTEWSTDGVHLTPKGYALLARTIRSALPKTLPPDTTILCFGDSLTYGIGVRKAGAAETAETYPAQLRSLIHEGR